MQALHTWCCRLFLLSITVECPSFSITKDSKLRPTVGSVFPSCIFSCILMFSRTVSLNCHHGFSGKPERLMQFCVYIYIYTYRPAYVYKVDIYVICIIRLCLLYLPVAEIGGEKKRWGVEWWKVFPSKLHTSSVSVTYYSWPACTSHSSYFMCMIVKVEE